MRENEREVGIVKALYHHPVKSMGGEKVDETEVVWTGIKGDRRYAFIKSEGSKSEQVNFPWFTGRDYPPIVLYKAKFVNPLDIDKSPVEVETPDGRVFPVDSEDLREELMEATGINVYLMRLGRGTYDGMPVSILGVATIESVGKRAGMAELEPRRFRPNILVETPEAVEGFEDNWVGGLLIIGDRDNSPKILVARKDPRCMMINIDPLTGKQTPQVLKEVAKSRNKEMGVYASVAEEGIIRVGDSIRLIKLF